MINQDVKSRVLREFLGTLPNPVAPFAKKELYDFLNFIELTETLLVSLFTL